MAILNITLAPCELLAVLVKPHIVALASPGIVRLRAVEHAVEADTLAAQAHQCWLGLYHSPFGVLLPCEVAALASGNVIPGHYLHVVAAAAGKRSSGSALDQPRHGVLVATSLCPGIRSLLASSTTSAVGRS